MVKDTKGRQIDLNQLKLSKVFATLDSLFLTLPTNNHYQDNLYETPIIHSSPACILCSHHMRLNRLSLSQPSGNEKRQTHLTKEHFHVHCGHHRILRKPFA